MYNWNLDDLKKLQKLYEKKARMCTDVNLQLEYESVVNNILDIIDNYNYMTQPSSSIQALPFVQKNNHFDVVNDDLGKIRLYSSYFPFIRRFRDMMDGTDVALQDDLQVFKTSQDGIVTLTTDFYHQYKGIFSSTYDSLADNFRNRLLFRKPSQDEKYGGNTYSVYRTTEVFIDCIKSNNVQDYISLIHESSHGITCKLNQDIMWDWNKYCLIEVDSLFFEMIGTDYASKLVGVQKDGVKTKIATFKDHLYSAGIICSKIDAYKQLSKKDLRNRRTISKFYKQEIGYDKDLTFDAMYSRIQEYMHYVISYLVAIELYMIYIKDQEKALDLLHKIIMLKNFDNKGYLLNIKSLGINPGENVKNYYELLLKEEGDLGYGKKLQHR